MNQVKTYCLKQVRAITHKGGRRGFTLAEMVLVVAVLAILIGISTPALYEMMRRNDIQAEELALADLRSAISARLADVGNLPDSDSPVSAWSAALAGYTNLSQAEIENDIWGTPRAFRVYLDSSRQIAGSRVPVYYVSVHSSGPNRQAEGGSHIGIQNNAFATDADSNWPTWWFNGANTAQILQRFGELSLAVNSDDQFLTFTDYPEKIVKFQETVNRLDRLTQALEGRAKQLYSQLLNTCTAEPRDISGAVTGIWAAQCNNGMPERLVYIPRSGVIPGTPADSDDNYYDAAPSDGIAVPIAFNPNDTEDNRRMQVQAIALQLGLSLSDCCNALDGKPFYLFSNPRERVLSTGRCIANTPARPNASMVKLPARLTLEYVPDALGTSTNPATCG